MIATGLFSPSFPIVFYPDMKKDPLENKENGVLRSQQTPQPQGDIRSDAIGLDYKKLTATSTLEKGIDSRAYEGLSS